MSLACNVLFTEYYCFIFDNSANKFCLILNANMEFRGFCIPYSFRIRFSIRSREKTVENAWFLLLRVALPMQCSSSKTIKPKLNQPQATVVPIKIVLEWHWERDGTENPRIQEVSLYKINLLIFHGISLKCVLFSNTSRGMTSYLFKCFMCMRSSFHI